jgi:hypothetical protein
MTRQCFNPAITLNHSFEAVKVDLEVWGVNELSLRIVLAVISKENI